MTHFSSANKSTIDRVFSVVPASAAHDVLGESGPPVAAAGRSAARGIAGRDSSWSLPNWLAARWAAHAFARPQSFERPDAEHVFLSTGHAFRVRGLAAWRWGSGPPVFLMHGWSGRGAELGAFVEPLVAKGYSVIAVDAKAHGASPGFEATLSDFADALLALEAHEAPPAAVVAHSFGTLAALLAVRRGLSPRALVLIAVPSPKRQLAMFSDAFGLSISALAAMKSLVEKRVGVPWDEVEGPSLAAGVRIPALVLHDRNDEETRAEPSRATAAALSAVFRATDGLGHQRILKDANVVATVTDFIAERGAAAWRAGGGAHGERSRVVRAKGKRRRLPVLVGSAG